MNRVLLLLKTLLLSTSRSNIYRYSTDRKKRRKIVGSTIGVACLYVLLMAYSIAMCIGLGMYGMIGAVPELCALLISTLAFVLTLFKTNGYLFHFKEYDMLMALPFETKTVAACKFLYMYIQSLPWYISISAAMMVGYGFFARPFFLVYLLWLVLSLFLPIIPMLVATFFGFLIARVSAGFKKTNIVQTILTLIFILFCFSLRFIIEDLFRNDKVEATLETASRATDYAANVYLPARWFSDAIIGPRPLAILLLVVVSTVLFMVVFSIIGRSYRRINSALKSHAAAGKYRISTQKQYSVVNAIAFKEFKRMTGSTTYMVNLGMGVILSSLLSVITLVVGPERIIQLFTQGASVDAAILRPAIPFIAYFFIGMVASTTCSPSLEGKNYWIVQSLPIRGKTLYRGKMLFNVYLTVPFMIFSVLCMCIAWKTPVPDMILYLILGVVLCFFSTARGCVCGIRHMRLDWENEVEVIKQGAAVAIYMLPNMFVVMGLAVLAVFLGIKTDPKLLTLIVMCLAAVLAALSYRRVMKMAERTAG